MQTLMMSNKWDNLALDTLCKKNEVEIEEICEEESYKVEPNFGAMFFAIRCAEYIANRKYSVLFLVSNETDNLLRETLNELDALLNYENVEDYIYKPTDHAYNTAKFYIKKMYEKMGTEFPSPSFDSDGEGGIDIEWRIDSDNQVMLSCRGTPEQEDFIYVKQGGNRFTELDISSTKLHKYLRELINA